MINPVLAQARINRDMRWQALIKLLRPYVTEQEFCQKLNWWICANEQVYEVEEHIAGDLPEDGGDGCNSVQGGR